MHWNGVLRHVPNALSAARIAAAPVLVVLAAGEHLALFTWVLVPALLSDSFDGLIARAFGLESRLGAQLDSIGDVLLLLASVFGIWVFHAQILEEHALMAGLALGLALLEYLVALMRYGRLSSFHTYASKVVGYLLGIFVGVLFVFGFEPWLFHTTLSLSILASCEEYVLLALLPEWRADVRGVWWVLRERRAGSPR